jgi:hypothetical protein
MTQNVKKKAFSVAALLLCCPVNEKVPWLWNEARKEQIKEMKWEENFV